MSCRNILAGITAGIVLIVMSGSVSATVIVTPTTAGVISGAGFGPSNCEPTCVSTVFGDSSPLSLLYRAGPGTADGGLFANSYAVDFMDSEGDPSADPSAAFMNFTFGPDIDSIECAVCYLAIKGSVASPGYYFYDLSSWDGVEWLSLNNFWIETAAISQLSIWGISNVSTTEPSSTVPEPATLALFGLGLVGLSLNRRRKKS